MIKNTAIIIDFDSTLVQVEALDELAAISLKRAPNRDAVLQDIRDTTRLGMEGSISIVESLERRIALLWANKKHLALLIKLLHKKITTSFKRNKKFLKQNAKNIYVFTSGFADYVLPITKSLGIADSHVFANSFTFDDEGNISGFDRKNVMAQDRGKIKQLQALKFKSEVIVIGDGYTDYQMKESGLVSQFFAFTENVERELVVKSADKVIRSFDEFLFQQKLPMTISYPKSKIKALLLEGVHPAAINALKSEGFSIEAISDALDEDELAKKIVGVSLLGIRSKTRVTSKVLARADKLLAIGAFCIGTEQVELDACSKSGVVVLNAPYSNTRSVVELAIGEIIMLMRKTFEASAGVHAGKWPKSASGCFEVRGKKLGIVGYGNIGSQLSVLAEGLGMEVYYYDIVERLALGNAKRCKNLHELLRTADIVTLHIDGRTSNKNLMGEREFSAMKSGSIFLNLSRGHVVNIDALVSAIKSGKIAGAGVDVFPSEPKSTKEEFLSPLRGFPNVILTPHVGGSTLEAQKNIGDYVAARLIDYVNAGSSFGSVNFPPIQLPSLQGAHRLLHIHRNVPGILAKINGMLADHKINILGQHLKTTEQIGYVITDVNKEYDSKVIAELKKIPDTIKFRVLY